jgi:hypothetical protein
MGGGIEMMTKTARWSTPASASSDGSSRPLGEAAADVIAKRLCMIPVPRLVWLVGLGLAVGITLTAGGSASADDQSSSRNANVVRQLLELGANPSTIAPSSVPKCSSPASSNSPSPLRILDNQTYALCAVASCVVFNEVAYCKCDVKTGDSISLTLNFDDENVCTVNEEGAATGSYMVSTFSIPSSVLKGGDMASYNCPGATPGRAGSDGAYAQCDGGICFTSTQGQPSPFSDEPLAKDEIICSCPITEQNPKSPVGYTISGPYPCQQSYFENCSRKTTNKMTGSMLQVGSPPGAGEVLGSLLTGEPPPPTNMCFLPP